MRKGVGDSRRLLLVLPAIVVLASFQWAAAHLPAYEGERVRGADLYTQMGGGKTQATELVTEIDCCLPE